MSAFLSPDEVEAAIAQVCAEGEHCKNLPGADGAAARFALAVLPVAFRAMAAEINRGIFRAPGGSDWLAKFKHLFNQPK